MFWEWILDAEMGGIEHLALYLLQNMSFRGVMKYRELMPKGVQQIIKFGAENAPSSFFEILDRLGGQRNLDDLGDGKNGPKSKQTKLEAGRSSTR